MTIEMPNITEKDAQKELNKSVAEAEEILKDKEKTDETLNDAFEKAEENRRSLEKVWKSLQLMFMISKDYVSGNYKDVPYKSVALIIGAIIYFLMPVDLIPDFIPVLGYVDDVMVIGLVAKQINSDLEKYNEWKKEN